MSYLGASGVPQQSSYSNTVQSPVIQTPSIPYSGASLGSTPQQSIANQQAYNNAVQAANSAYTAAVSSVNNAYTYVTNVYNNTTQAVQTDYSGAIANVLSQVNDTQGLIINAVNAALQHSNDLVQNIHNDQINNTAALIHAVQSVVNGASTTVNTQTSVDLSPIATTVDRITNTITDDIHNAQQGTRDTIQAIYDNQARLITATQDNTSQLVHAITDGLNSGIREAIDGINHDTGGIQGIFGLTDDAITKLLQEIWSQFTIAVAQLMNNLVGDAVLKLTDKAEFAKEELGNTANRFTDLFDKLKGDKYKTLDDFIADFAGGSINQFLINLVLDVMTVLSGATKLTDVATATYYQKLLQLSMAKVMPTLPQMPELVKMAYRKDITYRDYLATANKLGFSQDWSDSLYLAAQTRLQPADYMRNTFIFQKNIQDMSDKLMSMGYPQEEIDILIENYQGGVPPIQDLIRFMVRDTFSPIAETYGQFEDFPEKIMDYWSAQPIGDMWAKHYWGAHWELISIQQALEMYHRRKGNSDDSVITFDELKQFLKAKDVMPFWRDKLIETAYNPVTRVDIRRIYNMGLKDSHWVYNRYLDAGYSPENAQALTDFTIHSQDESDVSINKQIRATAEKIIKLSFDREIISSIEASQRLVMVGVRPDEAQITTQLWQFDRDTERDYKKGVSDKERMITQLKTDYEKRIIDRSYATNTLIALGLTQQDAENELKYSDLRADLKLRELKLNAIQTELVKWRIDRNTASQRMLSLGCKQSEIDYLLDIWTAEREKKDRQLSETDVNKIFKAGKMSYERYVSYMTTLGFDSEEINWLAELNAPSNEQSQ